MYHYNMYNTMIVMFAMVGSVSSFQTHFKPNFKFEGATRPLGYFDPLKVSTSVKPNQLKYLREAELQHGRIAMLSAVILPLLEMTHPGTLGIDVLWDGPVSTQLSWLGGFAFYEIARILKGYKNPGDDLFTLKEDHEPGQVFPQSVFTTPLESDMMNKELNNARLAMLAVTHILGVEYFAHMSAFV